MATDEQCRQIWEFAGPWLSKDGRGLQSAQASWKCIVDLMASIPDSSTGEYLEPGECFEEGEVLVIAYRAQNAFVIGMPVARIAQADPPTWVSPNDEEPKWTTEFESISDWFCVTVFWSLVNEGRGIGGWAGKGGRAARKRLQSECNILAPQSSRVGIEFLALPDGTAVACFAGKEIYGWARSEDCWNRLSQLGRINWSYCTLDES